MKRIIISTALSLVVGLGAMGQTFSPLPGAINKAECTKGLQAVTVNVPSGSYINREAKGYVELYRNGDLIMQIPAQNSQKLYMYEGFATHLKTGPSMMIAFWSGGTESMIAGSYEVKVPEGFIMLGGTTPNQPLTAIYSVPTYTPEEMGQVRGEKIPEIHALTITLPEGATNVKYTDNSEFKKWNASDSEPTWHYSISVNCGKYAIYDKVQDVAIDGNKVTLTFANTYASPGVYTIEFLSGALTYDLNGVTRSYTNVLTYNVTGNITGWEINPANGSTLKGGFKVLGTYKANRTVYVDNKPTTVEADVPYYFTIDVPVPDGETASAFTQAPALYLLNDDGSLSAKPVVSFSKLEQDPNNPKRFRVIKSVLQKYNVEDLIVAPGNYVLRLPANCLRYSGGSMTGQVDFNFTIEEDVSAVRNYTVSPANEGEVKEITTITLTYPEGTNLTWANAGWATLSNGIAEYAFIYHNLTSNKDTEYYQSITLDGNKVTFHLANPIREAGVWTLNIPVNSLLADGKSAPSIDKWTVVPPPVIKLDDIFSLAVPATSDFTQAQSFQNMGMGIIQWNITAEGIMINRECVQKVLLFRDGEQIAELDPANDAQITTTGAGQAAEGDDTVIGISDLIFVFAQNAEEAAEFQKSGTYKIIVPDGLLLNITTPVDGAEVTYNYTAASSIDFDYVLTPADGETVKATGLTQISLTFPQATSIMDNGTSAYLYFPNGDRVRGRSSLSVIEGNKITWKFEDPKSGPINWVNGEYKFVVAPNNLAIDMTEASYDGENGNFPGLTAYFNLQTSVGVDGIDAEISYNVVGIDGTVLVENGTADALKALAPGLYIINGRKVIVK